MIGWLINVEQLLKWELTEEPKVLRRYPCECHFVHQKSHMIWPQGLNSACCCGEPATNCLDLWHRPGYVSVVLEIYELHHCVIFHRLSDGPIVFFTFFVSDVKVWINIICEIHLSSMEYLILKLRSIECDTIVTFIYPHMFWSFSIIFRGLFFSISIQAIDYFYTSLLFTLFYILDMNVTVIQ
jgi:hypothetical protein